VGLLVDRASQVEKIPVSLIEPAPEEVTEIDKNYIRGVAKLQRRLVILMDLPRVLALDAGEPAAP
jgi:purine-binding chemotaxis protein CheW